MALHLCRGVGKTSFVLSFVGDPFVPNHIPTIGVDFRIRTFELNGEMVKVPATILYTPYYSMLYAVFELLRREGN